MTLTPSIVERLREWPNPWEPFIEPGPRFLPSAIDLAAEFEALRERALIEAEAVVADSVTDSRAASNEPTLREAPEAEACPMCGRRPNQRHSAALATTPPPPGTRLVLATEILMDALASFTEDGRRITFEWGEPDEHGWYAPTFTAAVLAATPPPLDANDWRELFAQIGQKWAALLEHYDFAEDATPEDIIRVAERRGAWDALARQGLRPPRPPKPSANREWDGS